MNALVSRQVQPVWTWDDWKEWLRAPATDGRWRTEASLREFPSSREPKHAHPLNLLRLYLAEASTRTNPSAHCPAIPRPRSALAAALRVTLVPP